MLYNSPADVFQPLSLHLRTSRSSTATTLHRFRNIRRSLTYADGNVLSLSQCYEGQQTLACARHTTYGSVFSEVYNHICLVTTVFELIPRRTRSSHLVLANGHREGNEELTPTKP